MKKRTKRRISTKNILTIDVGGSRVKVMTSRVRKKHQFSSGLDLSAKAMVKKIKDLTKDWSYDVISLGYPGPVIRNRPFAEPHNLGHGWAGFDFARAFDRPTRVVNDALMQALGSYKGGLMLFLGLGTGLGSAMIVDGVLAPMELGHLPYRKGKTFEDYVGAAGLKRLGKKKWQRKVADVVERLAAALHPSTSSWAVATRKRSGFFRAGRGAARITLLSSEDSDFGAMAQLSIVGQIPGLIPGFDGALFSREWKDALWDRFFTAAPQRQRQSVEQYKIVKRA